MINADFTVEPANWTADSAELRRVRHAVFVIEQAVPEDEEWDELDAVSQHVIARDPAGQPIGTGRLTPKGTIGRMAVVLDWRGRGVGDSILRVLLEQHAPLQDHRNPCAVACAGVLRARRLRGIWRRVRGMRNPPPAHAHRHPGVGAAPCFTDPCA